MKLSPAIRGYFTDATVSLAGPVANLMLAGVGYMLGLPDIFALYSLALAIVNLLPVSGLDGGSILSGILYRLFDPNRAYITLRLTTVATALVTWGASVYIMLVAGGDPSLFFISSAVLFTALSGKQTVF